MWLDKKQVYLGAVECRASGERPGEAGNGNLSCARTGLPLRRPPASSSCGQQKNLVPRTSLPFLPVSAVLLPCPGAIMHAHLITAPPHVSIHPLHRLRPTSLALLTPAAPTSAARPPPPTITGAYDLPEQAGCAHDLMALKSKTGPRADDLNFPASTYEELLPFLSQMPQVSCQGSQKRAAVCWEDPVYTLLVMRIFILQ